MQKPNYPKAGWREVLWILKSDWEQYVRTFAVTAAVVSVTIFTAQLSQHGIIPAAFGSPPGHSWVWYALWLCAFIYFVTSCLSITKDARRRKYDPTLALKYTDIFFEDIKDEKRKATDVLITFHSGSTKWIDFPDACEIEPVLDVLDDLGFLLQGQQLSDWVVYQYFSFWVQLYYEASQDYIELRRSKDTTLWEHLPELYSDMMKIQSHKNKKPAAELIFGDDLVQLLKDENSMRS